MSEAPGQSGFGHGEDDRRTVLQPAGEGECGERAEESRPGGEQDGGADGVAGRCHADMLAQMRADRNGAGRGRMLQDRSLAEARAEEGARPGGMPCNVPILNVSHGFLAFA